jgi:hypothetical protein
MVSILVRPAMSELGVPNFGEMISAAVESDRNIRLFHRPIDFPKLANLPGHSH